MLDFNKEAEKMCVILGIDRELYMEYLVSQLDIIYTRGRIDMATEIRDKGKENEQRTS